MRYGRRMVLALGLIALMLGSLAGPQAAQAQNVVKIGVEGPIPGPLAKMGQALANAVKLAAEEGRRSSFSGAPTRTTRRRVCRRRRRRSPIPP